MWQCAQRTIGRGGAPAVADAARDAAAAEVVGVATDGPTAQGARSVVVMSPWSYGGETLYFVAEFSCCREFAALLFMISLGRSNTVYSRSHPVNFVFGSRNQHSSSRISLDVRQGGSMELSTVSTIT
ncbi:hypothetical protein SETIT_9G248500v2 [Setaria italica]|uniref:Uncharacterized protein n=1 Tax=Setaria italica TaxID=4555 RepID=A0A368SKC8_SETIT|nr:hypothetical protein SETIT_9G248500v2 [Setaria italica]